jgi:hypothetical protein
VPATDQDQIFTHRDSTSRVGGSRRRLIPALDRFNPAGRIIIAGCAIGRKKIVADDPGCGGGASPALEQVLFSFSVIYITMSN